MPKIAVKSETEMTMRQTHIKADVVVTIAVDGREIPNVAVLGNALDDSVELIQKAITKSYEAVPARV